MSTGTGSRGQKGAVTAKPPTRPARPGTRPTFGYGVFCTIAFAVSIAIAAVAFWPVYETPRYVIAVGVAFVLGAVIAIVGTVWRWPSPVVLLASVAAFLLVGVPVAVPSKAVSGVIPTLEGLVDLVAGVALGWKQLLTITLPVGDYEALLVPAFVLVFTMTVLGLSVALRTSYGELAVLAPVVVFGIAIAFGPSVPSRPLDVPIALLAVLLFWLVWFRWYRRRAAIRLLQDGSDAAPSTSTGVVGVRTVVSAALILALASGAAVAAAAVIPPTEDRTVLRTTTVQPFDPRDYVSPLAGFRSYWQPANADEVLMDVTGLPTGAGIRLATLDTYDGVVYSVGSAAVTTESGSFTRVPSSFDQSRTDGEQATIGVTIAGYSGVWVPTIGKFETVQFAGDRAGALRDAFYYNDTTGTAAVIGGLDTGDSYTITAVLPTQPDADQLAELEPGSATVPTAQNVPDALIERLDEYVRGIETPGARLVAMLDGLARDGYVSHGVGDDEPASRSGHAADRISQLLTDPRMIGDAEQYAVAAALMASDLGFPARVVLGFIPDGNQGSAQIRGSDVTAWIEISTAQYGWVAIDPNPEVRDIPEELPEDTQQVARPQTIVPPPIVENEQFDRQLTPDTEQDQQDGIDPVLQAIIAALRVVGWVLLAIVILLSPFIVIIAAKLRRRRLRRSSESLVDRISGGWREFEDSAIDHGIEPAPSATRSEIADLVERRIGGAQAGVLAAVADRAVFSAEEPSEAEAESVWRVVDELGASLDHELTTWQRLKARISLRSLGGVGVSRLFTQDGIRIMTCAACGAELPDGALICGVCGRSVSSTAQVGTRPQAKLEAAPTKGDTAQLDPFPWGLPAASTAEVPRTAPVEPLPAPERPAGERFVLQFSTGESFTVTGTGLVGRNPNPEPGEYFDHAVSIADPGKSVSKTHLEFGQDDGVFWISDRFSGNGTLARDPEGQPKRCEPGRRYRVVRGGRVDIGDQFFVVS